MANVKTNTPAQQPKAKPATTPVKPAAATSKKAARLQPSGNQAFLFDKDNYMWMIIGVVLIIIGFFLMAGGKSQDPHRFLYEEIYSFRRITLAPIVMLIGFGIEVYAIMKTPKENTVA